MNKRVAYHFTQLFYLFLLTTAGCLGAENQKSPGFQHQEIQSATEFNQSFKTEPGQTASEMVPQAVSIADSYRTALNNKLSNNFNYLWYFGDWNNLPSYISIVEEARNFQLVLIHPTNSNITPEQAFKVKIGHDEIEGTEDDVVIIGYLSVGEDIRTDKDHNRPIDRGDGLGPVYWDYEKQEKVYQKNGYASYYLDDRNKDGLPDRNWQYLGCYADPGNKDYQLVLRNGTKETEGFAGLEELFSLYNCDGVFLDTMDVVNPIGWGFPFYFEWTAQGGRDFIHQVREWYPDKLILLNRTMVYFDPNQTQENGTPYLGTWGKDILVDIDLLLFEGFYWPGDEVRNRYYWAPRLNAEADRNNSFTILVLDYVGDAEIVLDGNFSDWDIQGVPRQGVEKLDDALIWSKGIRTPDETKDCDVPEIDTINFWMANKADNSQIFLRLDFSGVIDFAKYNYYIYLDTDQSKETGFWNVDNAAIGSDFLIHDGDASGLHLYRYATPKNHHSWNWEWIGTIPSAIGFLPEDSTGSGSGSGTGLEIAIEKSLINESDNFDEALDLFVFTEDNTGTPYTVDSAPDNHTKDYYQFLSRTKHLGFTETVIRQGWISYNKPLFDGNIFNPVDTSALKFFRNVDVDAPEWDSTAASPGVLPPAKPVPRIGIQEAEAGDGSLTVRWDVARDQTRPVRYTIYYSKESPVNPETAEKIENVDLSNAGKNYYSGTGHRTDFPNGTTAKQGFYSEKIGEGVYPYEYTIYGLENDTTYYCMVRAYDSAVPPNIDENTVELAATPRARLNSTYTSGIPITVDGLLNDWKMINPIDFSPGEAADSDILPPDLDILDISITEDNLRLYFAFVFGGPIDFGSNQKNISVFLDTDLYNSTGYAGPYIPAYPWAIGADYLIQNGNLYQHEELNGFRIWNWKLIAFSDMTNPGTLGHTALPGNQLLLEYASNNNTLEISILKEAISYTDRLFLQVDTDQMLVDGDRLGDKAPNDPFSHYYIWDTK